ncbi:enoyl-CoA hydratase-related protein [Aquamicrobium sp. LC103]|uniref:enoyl-CoA hydratase/isomerase family protein n=1 Tax=Aquamicrobium sp. LC103 TaxID=1120658 RepID=UPI00063EB678|nr:enoyl-CoA hydratase-related protein [Aquamicrobium sp. LC103]TKT74498.1 enoyl-CoA hydratase/isomerase family protein [Aquamicrobium sp. LC103]
MLNTETTKNNPRAVEVTIEGGVAVVALNRPDQINAINEEIRLQLPQALQRLEDDVEIRAILLHGGTARGFCAGADIKEIREAETSIEVRERNMRRAWIDAFDRVTKPVIAAVHGHCLGGGMEMALACDIRVACADATFALPETGLGLIPGAGGTQRLQRLVGHGRALDLLLTGDRIDAAEAFRIGLVTRLVADRKNLLEEAIALAGRIATRAPRATAYAKEAARAAGDLPLAAGQAFERNLFALLSTTSDRMEAARAFKEKRKPVFTGK